MEIIKKRIKVRELYGLNVYYVYRFITKRKKYFLAKIAIYTFYDNKGTLRQDGRLVLCLVIKTLLKIGRVEERAVVQGKHN